LSLVHSEMVYIHDMMKDGKLADNNIERPEVTIYICSEHSNVLLETNRGTSQLK
jgi:hypothetical protein